MDLIQRVETAKYFVSRLNCDDCKFKSQCKDLKHPAECNEIFNWLEKYFE